MKHSLRVATALLVSASLAACATTRPAPDEAPAGPLAGPGPVAGWLHWRGPDQDGVSHETDLPDTLAAEGAAPGLWTYPLAGRGAPIVVGDRVYVIGYRGDGPELEEVIAAVDADTGGRIWEVGFADFLSDIIYERYSIGAPGVDPATGHVFVNTSPGLLVALNPAGEILWERSLMEDFGRLTFPNGRTGMPVVDGDLVIVHGITSNWGRGGPGRDRFYAFHKATGELVWWSAPGVRPIDSSFATPVLGSHGDRRVLWAGTGCGNIVCVDLADGAPIWRFQMATGGVNATVVAGADGKLVAVHGKENLDSTEAGRMIALDPTGGEGVLPATAEVWRAPLRSFTSSPVAVGGRVYQVTATADLVALDQATGREIARMDLGEEQLHASPTWADGKLYIPVLDGKVHVVRTTEAGLEPVSEVELEGRCLGAPAVYAGRVYVHTTEKLYAFGEVRRPEPAGTPAARTAPAAGEATRLLVRPAEVHLRPGGSTGLTLQGLDAAGRRAGAPINAGVAFADPGAAAAAGLSLDEAGGALTVAADAAPTAVELTLTHGGLEAGMRVRVAPARGWGQDFEGFEDGAHPPGNWTSSKLKWRIAERDGSKVMVKTLERVLFQRSTTFIGHPDERGYTLEADVMTDGTRRGMGVVGVVNQRYVIALDGNKRLLEVHSNFDRVQHGVPFTVTPGMWYRLKTRVDVAEDGSGVVRAKAWSREAEEPEGWMLEHTHARAHQHGAPGLYGFGPQSQHPVYIDNVRFAD